ncbi:uncharacterized protein [Rhodnius prolixus]|uniref:uncharacterized protein n=1 Tax=Rhodnius prolixus TaxID=13249 RepID=UPI003D18993C
MMKNKIVNFNSKSPARGIPQVTEEVTQAGSELKDDIVQDLEEGVARLRESVSEGSGNADQPETEALARVSQELKEVKKKASGAQRKKLAKLKAAEAGREWLSEKDWRERRREQKSSSVVHQSGGQGEAPPIASDWAGKEKEVRVARTPSPKTCQTPKRPSSEVCTAYEKAMAQGSKRMKFPEKEHTGSFRDALSALKMAVVLDSFPNDLLGMEQADLLQRKLAEQICRNPGGIRPQFRGCFLSRGALIVNCDNELSRLWLERVVPELQVGEGARLRVGLARNIMRVAKVAMWISGAHKNASPSVVLESLNVQNEGLETANWRVINRKVEPKGQILVFDLSEPTLSRLKRSNFEVFLGLDIVKLRVVSKPIDGAADNDPPKLLEVASGEPPPQ